MYVMFGMASRHCSCLYTCTDSSDNLGDPMLTLIYLVRREKYEQTRSVAGF